MDILPVFAYPTQFAEISGLSVKQIRRLCQKQIIPNERTRHGFRVDVQGSLNVLRERAAEFVGHEYIAPRIDIAAISRRSKGKNFLEMIDNLKRG